MKAPVSSHTERERERERERTFLLVSKVVKRGGAWKLEQKLLCFEQGSSKRLQVGDPVAQQEGLATTQRR